MQVNGMSEPTLSKYLVRVGGVCAVFAIAILVTTAVLPGYEGYVVLIIAGLGICYLTAKEIIEKNRHTKKKGKKGQKGQKGPGSN